jgi:hypothetical protein
MPHGMPNTKKAMPNNEYCSIYPDYNLIQKNTQNVPRRNEATDTPTNQSAAVENTINADTDQSGPRNIK